MDHTQSVGDSGLIVCYSISIPMVIQLIMSNFVTHGLPSWLSKLYAIFVDSESSQLTSDGAETCDDQAGEADDEQSDFFHELEPGPTYGIPSMCICSTIA